MDILSKEPLENHAQKQLKSAFDILQTDLYVNDESLVCKIHDTFKDYLKDEIGKHHNCTGCNLAEFTDLLFDYCEDYGSVKSELESFTKFILPAYLVVERMEEIFSIVELQESYRLKNFQTFRKIRRWANFLKLPKSFILVHHARYLFEDYVTIDNVSEDKDVVINDSFIQEYYTGEKNNKKLYRLLTNHTKVYVLLPGLADLTAKFCKEVVLFVEVISKNEIIKELLKDKTTIEGNFEREIEPTDTNKG